MVVVVIAEEGDENHHIVQECLGPYDVIVLVILITSNRYLSES